MITPLMRLCEFRKDSQACLQRIINRGAKINAQDFLGGTALMHASQGSLMLTLRRLLENGAALSLQTLEGETAITGALQVNSHGAISLLISHGADLTCYTPSQRSLLHIAAKFGDEATLVILALACIRGIDVNHKGKDGATAWDLARARNHISSEWPAAFANLVVIIKERIPDPTANSDHGPSARAFPVPRVRLSDLIRIVEDNLYRWAIQANGYLNAMLLMSVSAGFLVLAAFGCCLAYAYGSFIEENVNKKGMT